MASRLIGLSGYAQSGKDTTAAVLIERHGFTRVSFADALRDALYAMNPKIAHHTGKSVLDFCNTTVQELVDGYGWERAKTESPDVRSLLQRLGTEVGRNILGENIWVDIAMRKVDAIPGPVVITDMRFPNEYESIVARGGETWRIIRPGFEPVNAHPSETALDDAEFNVRILNGGTLDGLAMEVNFIQKRYIGAGQYRP